MPSSTIRQFRNVPIGSAVVDIHARYAAGRCAWLAVYDRTACRWFTSAEDMPTHLEAAALHAIASRTESPQGQSGGAA
jgi:hypothetical protein